MGDTVAFTPPAGSRFNIRKHEGEPFRAIQDILQRLGHQNEILHTGGTLIAVVSKQGRARAITRGPDAPQRVALTAATLGARLSRIVAFQKQDRRKNAKNDWRACDPPYELMRAMIEMRDPGDIPELRAISECPVILPNGTIISTPGLHESSGIYLANQPPGGMVNTSKPPTRADALSAVEEFVELLAEFPFVEDGDRSAALAATLTPFAAPGIDASPIPGVTADTAGSGKSEFCNFIANLATGRNAPVMSYSANPEEQAKRLDSVSLAGDQLVLIDNISTTVAGDELAQMATQGERKVRVMGSHNLINITVRTLIMLNGNNLTIRGDLNRRVVLIRMSPGIENPESRTFSQDLLRTVRERRPELINKILSIPRVYLDAGAPDVDCQPFGSFKDWDLLVRRPLIWLGLPDPLTPARTLREEDPDAQVHLALLAAWRERFGDKPVTAAEVIAEAMAGDKRMDRAGMSYDAPELYEAVNGACGKTIDARSLGYALRRYRGRVLKGMRLERGDMESHGGTARWRVVTL